MDHVPETMPLPDFVSYSIFPFEGDLRVRPLADPLPKDWARPGEPGGAPCGTCETGDESYIWVDDHWRVRGPERRSGVPVQLFLETRDHLDMADLSPELAGELGQLIVRLDHAIGAVEGIGRVHLNRWGDGGSHFHMWFYGRPVGATQLLGFCLPMWAMILPPTEEEIWQRNLAVVASRLADGGGTAMVIG